MKFLRHVQRLRSSRVIWSVELCCIYIYNYIYIIHKEKTPCNNNRGLPNLMLYIYIYIYTSADSCIIDKYSRFCKDLVSLRKCLRESPGANGNRILWWNLVSSLLLVVMPGAPSSFLLLVVRPGAPSSVFAPSSNQFYIYIHQQLSLLRVRLKVARVTCWRICLRPIQTVKADVRQQHGPRQESVRSC